MLWDTCRYSYLLDSKEQPAMNSPRVWGSEDDLKQFHDCASWFKHPMNIRHGHRERIPPEFLHM